MHREVLLATFFLATLIPLSADDVVVTKTSLSNTQFRKPDKREKLDEDTPRQDQKHESDATFGTNLNTFQHSNTDSEQVDATSIAEKGMSSAEKSNTNIAMPSEANSIADDKIQYDETAKLRLKQGESTLCNDSDNSEQTKQEEEISTEQHNKIIESRDLDRSESTSNIIVVEPSSKDASESNGNASDPPKLDMNGIHTVNDDSFQRNQTPTTQSRLPNSTDTDDKKITNLSNTESKPNDGEHEINPRNLSNESMQTTSNEDIMHDATGDESDDVTRSTIENKEQSHKSKDQKGNDDERVVVNYAHKNAGAIILEKSPSFKGTSNLLTSDNDKYAIAPCNEKKTVVIGLSEDILVKKIVLANFERFSSHIKNFQVLGSQTYPIGDWHDLGTYSAKPGNGVQTFDLLEPSWARYLQFKFVSHYGEEHYCTISQIKVHGSTMLQGFHEQWEKENKEMLQEDIKASSEKVGTQEETGNDTIEVDDNFKQNVLESVDSNGDSNDKKNSFDAMDSSQQKVETGPEISEYNQGVGETEEGTSSFGSIGTNTDMMDIKEVEDDEGVVNSIIGGDHGSGNDNKLKDLHNNVVIEEKEGLQEANESVDKEETNGSSGDMTKLSDADFNGVSEDSKLVEIKMNLMEQNDQGDKDEMNKVQYEDEYGISVESENDRIIAVPDPAILKDTKGTTKTRINVDTTVHDEDHTKTKDIAEAISDAVQKIKEEAVKRMTEGPTLSYDTVKKLSMVAKEAIVKQLDNETQSPRVGQKSEPVRRSDDPALSGNLSKNPPEELIAQEMKYDEKNKKDLNDLKTVTGKQPESEKGGENNAQDHAKDPPRPHGAEKSPSSIKIDLPNDPTDETASDNESILGGESSEIPKSTTHTSLPSNPMLNVHSVDGDKVDKIGSKKTPPPLSDSIRTISCFDQVGSFNDFKAKVAAQRTAKSNSLSGSGIEPIFKTLTDEIKALQSHQTIYEHYSQNIIKCYDQIILDMSKEINRLETDQEKRMMKLEYFMKDMLENQKQRAGGKAKSFSSRISSVTLAAAASSSTHYFLTTMVPVIKSVAKYTSQTLLKISHVLLSYVKSFDRFSDLDLEMIEDYSIESNVALQCFLFVSLVLCWRIWQKRCGRKSTAMKGGVKTKKIKDEVSLSDDGCSKSDSQRKRKAKKMKIKIEE